MKIRSHPLSIGELINRKMAARDCAKSLRIAMKERDGDTFIFARRLEYNARANTWYDLRTGERGSVKGVLTEVLLKFFPQLTQEMSGGPR